MRYCLSCGADISDRRSDALTCSDRCRLNFHRQPLPDRVAASVGAGIEVSLADSLREFEESRPVLASHQSVTSGFLSPTIDVLVSRHWSSEMPRMGLFAAAAPLSVRDFKTTDHSTIMIDSGDTLTPAGDEKAQVAIRKVKKGEFALKTWSAFAGLDHYQARNGDLEALSEAASGVVATVMRQIEQRFASVITGHAWALTQVGALDAANLAAAITTLVTQAEGGSIIPRTPTTLIVAADLYATAATLAGHGNTPYPGLQVRIASDLPAGHYMVIDATSEQSPWRKALLNGSTRPIIGRPSDPTSVEYKKFSRFSVVVGCTFDSECVIADESRCVYGKPA